MTDWSMTVTDGEQEESISARLVSLMDDKLAQCNGDRAAAAVLAADELLAHQGRDGAEWVDEVIMRALVALLKNTKKKQEKAPRMDVTVAWNGALVKVPTPKVYAVPKSDDAGRQVWEQGKLLIDCAWDDLRRVWNAVVAQREVLDGRALVIRGLLDLHAEVPGAATPREAMVSLGKSTDAFTLTLAEAVS